MSDPATPALLADRAGNLHKRIARALAAAGRPPGSCRLLAVSKTRSAAEVRAAAGLGLADFGENYVQEALAKMDQLADLPLTWHLIGPLQSNKTAEVAARFQWVHSLDRERIARRLNDQRPAGLPPLQVCLQVNLDDEDSKAGLRPDEVPALALAVLALPRLQLRGLMAIPRPGQPAGDANAFARLAACLAALKAKIPAPAAAALDTLSMGMSDDFEDAIAHGATWVRIGTQLFGTRPAKADHP